MMMAVGVGDVDALGLPDVDEGERVNTIAPSFASLSSGFKLVQV